MVACSHGCLHLQVYRFVRVSCRWRCLCFSEPSNFLEIVCFRESRFERSFLRCSHCADVGFLSDCHSLTVRATAMRFCSLSTAQVRFVERNARDKRTALRILLVAPLVSIRTRTLQADSFSPRRRGAGRTLQNTGNKLVARRRSDSLKTCSANPYRSRGKTRCCDMLELQQSLGHTKNSAQSATVLLQRLQTPAKASMNFFLWLQDPSKQGFSLRQKKVTRFLSICNHRLHGHAHALHGHHSRHGRHAGDCL